MILACMILFMNNRAIGNIIVIKFRVLVGKTDIEATKIILVRQIMAIAIIDRLSFQTQYKLWFFKVCLGNGVVDYINYAADGAIGIQQR